MERIKVLFIEDSSDDLELIVRELRKGNFDPDFKCVEDADQLLAALHESEWDIVLSDHILPEFNSFQALDLVRAELQDIPFIVISGTVGEEVAVEVMKAGANDYLLKDSLIRLAPAVRRELAEANSRREKRSLEAQLHQAQKMEAVGQLTGGIAHDFNNLLAVILGNIEMAEEANQKGGDIAQYAAAVRRAGEHGATLISKLLTFSRKQILAPKVLSPVNLVRGMTDLLRTAVGEAIELEISAGADIWPCEIDAALMESAILNLAINARDAMPDGGRLSIEIANSTLASARITVHDLIAPGDYVMISITDTGVGMSPEIIRHAVEPFFTTKDVGRGTGLGLSMVYGFLKQSGGDVIIESAEGKGTIIRLYLPRSDALPESEDEEQRFGAPKASGESVLVIEDNDDLRALAVQMLASLGYAVVQASTASAAREILQGRDVDLILSDVVLAGGMSGPQFITEIRASHPELKVVFMSGFPAESMQSSKMITLDDILMQKPFGIRELASTLHEVLSRP